MLHPIKRIDSSVVEEGGSGKVRAYVFLAFFAVIFLAFRRPLGGLLQASLSSELYSHILLIPVISMYLVWAERKKIFIGPVGWCPWGLLFAAVGIGLYFAGGYHAVNFSRNDHLSMMTFAAVLSLWGAFLIVFGASVFYNALFPLLFLLFAVPLPDFLMNRFISLLQYCSAETAYALFHLTGVAVYREGYVFQVPGLTIEVAKQCGGIRSGLVLLITSTLAGHMFLRTAWRKGILVVSAFPIAIFKNALRIVMLTLLGAYVDSRILSSDLHRKGGIPFFFGALALLGVVLWLLRRSERRTGTTGILGRDLDWID